MIWVTLLLKEIWILITVTAVLDSIYTSQEWFSDLKSTRTKKNRLRFENLKLGYIAWWLRNWTEVLKLCLNIMILCLVDTWVATISFIIFWDFSMFYQTFLSPPVKRWPIITYKHGMYELPHELPSPVSQPKRKFC